MIQRAELPPTALLRKYSESGAYTDCYLVQVAQQVTQAQYIEAFYSTWIFAIEQWILGWAVSRPSNEDDIRALAEGSADSFAAWSVEGRTQDQLLLCDYMARTRSWLMSSALPDAAGTRLYFGSAVVPHTSARTGHQSMGLAFKVLLGFHRLYSRVLLRAAVARLQDRASEQH